MKLLILGGGTKEDQTKLNNYVFTNNDPSITFFLVFWLAPVLRVLTNLRGAQVLGKEFLASAPRIIQEAIKLLQFDDPKRVKARMAA